MDLEARMKKAVKDAGITLTALSRKTGIEYWKIQASLSEKRELRTNEFFALCAVLGIDPMGEIQAIQARMANTRREQTGA